MTKKRMLLAMSHEIAEKQIKDFGGEVINSKVFVEEKCNQINPESTSLELKDIARKIVNEAISKECNYIIFDGDPCILFHVWTISKKENINIGQFIVKKSQTFVENSNGIYRSICISEHIKWREI